MPACIRLRPLHVDDRAAWIALHADPAAMAHVAPPLSPADAARRFAAALAANTVHPPRRRTWAIVADGEFAGVAGLVFDAPGEAELGAILATSAQGRGIATRALARLVEHASAAYGLQRVHTRHAGDHAAAAGLMRTLGFEPAADSAPGTERRWRLDMPTPVRDVRDAHTAKTAGNAGDTLDPIG